MAQYQQYKKFLLVFKMCTIAAVVQPPACRYVFTDTTFNNSNVTQKSTFKQSKSVTNSFTWPKMESRCHLQSAFQELHLEPLKKMSMDMSISSTQSQTKSETRTWEISREVTMPPKSKIVMTWTINEKESSAIFYADVVLTGYVATWNKDKIDVNNPSGSHKHCLWFIPIERVFRECRVIIFRFLPSIASVGVQLPTKSLACARENQDSILPFLCTAHFSVGAWGSCSF